MFNILTHQLTLNNLKVPFFPTDNQGGQVTPRFLVLHFTAGRGDEVATAKWFQNPNANASAHLTISQTGKISQSVLFNRVAWHAGTSTWKGINGLNRWSIGIEVCNPGPLEPIGNGQYKAWFGAVYTKADGVFEAKHKNGGPIRGWLPFTPIQIDYVRRIGKLLMTTYKIEEAVGHDMISPGRKSDPGPTMPDSVYEFLNSK